MRLELSFRQKKKLRLQYFNSIKVRLELIMMFSRSILTLFQFHKGAIRTALPIDILPSIKYFNSIKVRLELLNFLRHDVIKTKFQFHKGAIRTHHHYSLSSWLGYFNSIKVRLERFVSSPHVYCASISIP